MNNVPIKLNQLVEEFHYFEDNQVLTASHLNTVVDFLDRRDRMTRTKLIGTGIVCGLEVSFNNSNKTITISKGTAITSDGDLLHVDQDTIYSHVKLFDDQKAQYEYFQNGSQPIPLFQLFTADSPEENKNSLRGVNNPIQRMNEMALVLYLNSYLEAPEDCTEVDCENHGMRQVAKLTPLLIAKSDLDNINNKPNNPYFNLPEVNIRVPNYRGNINHEEGLLARIRSTVELSLPDLTKGIVASCGARQGDFLSNLIAPLYSNPIATWRTRMTQIFENININDRADVLYIYGFMKDLAKAYQEFKESIFELWTECCPDAMMHPKHIMVREIVEEEPNQPSTYRHHFCESPILNHQGQKVKKAQHLHQRMNAMIQHFVVPNNQNLPIKATPSKHGDYNLGDGSIPYYYNAANYQLHQFWNFDKTIRNQSNAIPSYRANQYNGTDAARNPLSFVKEQYNFYRIEGHLGKPRSVVEANLKTLKETHNLNFNVVSIQIQDDFLRVNLPWLRFPAIDMLFHHYREEFNANSRIVDKFNTDLASTSAVAVADKNTPEDLMREKLETSKVQINNMRDDINSAKNQVKTKLSLFNQNYKTFKTSYQKAAVRGDLIHKNVYEYTQTKYETPMQKFVLDYKFNRFDGLIKYFRKKKEKVQEQYTYKKFAEQNTGIESLGGVPVGGTFILVYAASDNEQNQRVVADFCLPTPNIVQVEPEVDPQEIPETEIEKPDISENIPDIKFIDKIDLYKYSPIRSIVDFKADFITQDLGKQIKDIQIISGAGLAGVDTGAFIGDAITDNTLKNAAGRLNETANGIKVLENKTSLTAKEEAELVFLRKEYDSSAESILGYVDAASEGEFKVTSDEAKIMEFIGSKTEELKVKDSFTKIRDKTKEIADKSSTSAAKKEIALRIGNKAKIL